MSEAEREWRERRGSLLEQNRYLLESGLHSDCSFTVGPPDEHTEVFEVHKSMLWRASSVFEAMFHVNMSETLCGEVRVTDVEPAVFKLLLRYVYCDEAGVGSCEEALSLSYAAHKYQMSHLLQRCVEYLCCHLEPPLVWQALTLAQLTSQPLLTQKCMQVVTEATEATLGEEGFEEVGVAVLCEVLQQETLNVGSEMVLVTAALRWARHQAQCLGHSKQLDRGIRLVLGPAFSLLRFLSLKPEEFADGPAQENWMSGDEKSCIFTNLISPGKAEMPSSLCSNAKPRKIPLCINSQLSSSAVWDVMKLPIYNPKTIININNMECILTFRVDKDIWLKGVSVSSQLNKPLIELGEIIDCDTRDSENRGYYGYRGSVRMGQGLVRGSGPARRDQGSGRGSESERGWGYGRGSQRGSGLAQGSDQGSGRGYFEGFHADTRMSSQRGPRGRRGHFSDVYSGTSEFCCNSESVSSPPNFLIAQNSARNYIENVTLCVGKKTVGLGPNENITEMHIQDTRNYNCLNYLQFEKPILIEKSDDLNSKDGQFYELTITFLKAGYYESGNIVEMLRFGNVDVKFNVDSHKSQMFNPGLVKSFTFYAV